MFLLLKSKRAKDSYESQKILLKRIKAAISSRSSKFGGYRQQVSLQDLNANTCWYIVLHVALCDFLP